MLLHDCEGTHRLELPVSRTTLNDWGGLPIVISEKSRQGERRAIGGGDMRGPTYTGRS